ncbi:MAG: outer membrane beta-barrel protein [Sedimentisphaerales bacterium]|nr:outer membrane beta-barrel protein [Sedimentisphaerales bacterium]
MVGKSCARAGKVGLVVLTAILVLSLSSPATAGMRFRLGISYINGLSDLADQYEDNLETIVEEEVGVDLDLDADTIVIPIGLTLFPYYQWDFGLMLGPSIGPFMFIWEQVSYDDYRTGDSWDESYTHWQLPVSMNVGFVLGPEYPVSFYVRGGPSYHFAGGDFYEGSNLGVVGAIGLEIFNSRHFRLGLEAAYDSAEVEIENLRTHRNENIQASEFSFSLFFLFK